MPVEVIDLLSSSSSPVASRAEAVSRKTQASWTEKATTQASSQNYLSSDSFLDLTEITHEKIPTSGSIQETSHGQNEPSKRAPLADNDFLFLSDDFDTTGDLDANTSANIRYSPPAPSAQLSTRRALTHTTSAAAGTTGPFPSRRAGLKHWNTVADPIEHSSSPIDLTRVNGSPSKTLKTAKSIRSTKTETLPTSDPFASSPAQLKPRSPKKQPEPKQKQTAAWDPISSSVPEISTSQHGDDDDNDNPFASPPLQGHKRTSTVIDLRDSSDDGFSSSEDELPELTALATSNPVYRTHSHSGSPPAKRVKTARGSTSDRSRSSKKAPKTEDEKEREQKRRAEAKEAEKELKRIEKERAKAQRAIDKEKEKALAEVNKLRTDKKVSAPEMIVDLPSSLPPGIKVQAQTLLDDLDVKYSDWTSPVDNVVKWRRKVQARFNEALGHWEPMSLRIQAENHVLVLIQAAEFVKLAVGPEGFDLEAHVLKMKTHFSGSTLIYLIEGLRQWMNKNRNTRNRQFQSAVRNLDPTADDIPPSSQAHSGSRRRKASPQHEVVDDVTIEDALLSLQVVHGTLIHHTNAPIETAQWIATFTQHISTIPYRRAREASSASAGFCMDSGQVQTGDGPRDTYIHMLQEIARVTAPMAYGIAAEYGTVSELVRGLETKGPLALEHCRKSANKDGAFTDRTVGQAVSRRLYRIFTGRDENSTDV